MPNKLLPPPHPHPNHTFWLPTVYVSLREEEEEVEEEVLLAAEAAEDLRQMGPSHKTHSLKRNSSHRTFHRVPRFT